MKKIERMKHVSKNTGGVVYLEVNHDAGTYSDDYHGAGASHWDAITSPEMMTRGEILFLTKYYADVLGYRKI